MPSKLARFRFLLPLVALVCLDACLKAAAVLFLEPDQVLGSSPNLQLMLRINRNGMGTWGQAFFQGASSRVLWQTIAGIVAQTIALVRLRKSRRGALFMVVAWVVASFAGGFLGGAVFGAFGTPPDFMIVPCMRLAQAALWITVWYLVQSRIWKLGFLLLAACATGNFLSLTYPPYAIVDFLFSAPLARLLGPGVINLADVAFLAAIPVLAFAAAHSLWHWLFKRGTSTNDDAALETIDGDEADDEGEEEYEDDDDEDDENDEDDREGDRTRSSRP